MNRPKEFLAWAVRMFGPVALNRRERVSRFLEEALELAHADCMELSQVDKIAWRVWSRPPGDLPREVGQAQATLDLLAESIGLLTDAEAAKEFERVQTIPQEEWTRRHAAKVAIGIAR